MHVKFEFAWSFLHFYHAKKIEVFFVIKVVISGNKMGRFLKKMFMQITTLVYVIGQLFCF